MKRKHKDNAEKNGQSLAASKLNLGIFIFVLCITYIIVVFTGEDQVYFENKSGTWLGVYDKKRSFYDFGLLLKQENKKIRTGYIKDKNGLKAKLSSLKPTDTVSVSTVYSGALGGKVVFLEVNGKTIFDWRNRDWQYISDQESESFTKMFFLLGLIFTIPFLIKLRNTKKSKKRPRKW